MYLADICFLLDPIIAVLGWAVAENQWQHTQRLWAHGGVEKNP